MSIVLAVAAILWLAIAAAAFRVFFSLRRLAPREPHAGPPPRVGVVVPARNEEAGVEASVRSLLAQEGVELHLIAVDDGSTDATGAILDRLAAADPRLEVLHAPELPEGWLGKVNALHQGAARARGDWLLFADADVVHHPRALASAIATAEEEGRDLVALLPRFEWDSPVEHGLPVALFIALVQFGSPRLEDPAFPDDGMGSGSFTLVRRTVYERAGGHAPLKASVLDDIELGRLIKRAGGRVALRLAPGLIRLRMYRGNREAFWGLSKNLVASFGGRVPLALLAAGVASLMLLAPIAAVGAGLVLGDGRLAAAGLGVYLFQLGCLAALKEWHRYRWHLLPAFPVFAFSATACVVAGSWRHSRRGVVAWRGRDVKL